MSETRTTTQPSAESDGFVRRYLDLSTAHMTEEVMANVATATGVLAYADTYGAWVWVPQHVEEHISDNNGEIPQCVIDVWRFARALGCDWVRLDSDAAWCAELPTYDW